MSSSISKITPKKRKSKAKPPKTTTTEPIRDKDQVHDLIDYYLTRGQIRNHVLIVLGIHTALRISDILSLCWKDVYDFETNCFKRAISIVEKKTRKSKTLALHRNCITALRCHFAHVQPHCLNHPIFQNEDTGSAISRIQAYRIIREASEEIGLEEHVSCHSLRKTFGYHAWKDGISPAVIMEIYNHSSLEVTKRYLGITQDDKDEVYLGLAL